jgi:hypothetical protein
MSARHITIHEERKCLLVGLFVDEQFQAGNERQESLAARFLYELILGSEMTIESPVSKSRSSHHSSESRLADSVVRELGACRFDNSLACLAVSTFDLRMVLGLPWRDRGLELVVGQRVEGLACWSDGLTSGGWHSANHELV